MCRVWKLAGGTSLEIVLTTFNSPSTRCSGSSMTPVGSCVCRSSCMGQCFNSSLPLSLQMQRDRDRSNHSKTIFPCTQNMRAEADWLQTERKDMEKEMLVA